MTGKMLRKAENGFTLLEVMAVLVLMAAIMAVVVPALFETVRSLQVRTAIRDVEALLGTARSEAIRTNSPVTVIIDYSHQRISIEQFSNIKPLQLHDDRLCLHDDGNGTIVRVDFWGDGSSSGGMAIFADSAGQVYRLDVAPSNGRWRIEKELKP